MEPQVCAKCFWTSNSQLNFDEMKLLDNKIDVTGGIKPFD